MVVLEGMLEQFFSPLVCGYDFLEYNFGELGRELNIILYNFGFYMQVLFL
jgi:hypothetical protein